MNNEPVAWMYNYENFPDSFVVCRARKSDQDIPLYTHSVKELTDDEIVWLWCDCEKDGTEATYIKFARAILRKAQEK